MEKKYMPAGNNILDSEQYTMILIEVNFKLIDELQML